jgi:hypothetical protein
LGQQVARQPQHQARLGAAAHAGERDQAWTRRLSISGTVRHLQTRGHQQVFKVLAFALAPYEVDELKRTFSNASH